MWSLRLSRWMWKHLESWKLSRSWTIILRLTIPWRMSRMWRSYVLCWYRCSRWRSHLLLWYQRRLLNQYGWWYYWRTHVRNPWHVWFQRWLSCRQMWIRRMYRYGWKRMENDLMSRFPISLLWYPRWLWMWRCLALCWYRNDHLWNVSCIWR
jgi:hypothetical protein